MRGDKVIVRAFGGEPLVRRVWAVSGRSISVADETGFQKLRNGDREAPMPVGIPMEDVFSFEPEAASRIGRGPWKWSSLSRYL